jgi:hypothetical protein
MESAQSGEGAARLDDGTLVEFTVGCRCVLYELVVDEVWGEEIVGDGEIARVQEAS